MTSAATLDVVVLSKHYETASICAFELVDPEGRDLPAFTAGAHVDVQLGPGLVRSYSLCNSPGERHRYCIGVLRERESRGGSRMLVESVQQGARLRISAPRNHFELAGGSGRSLLLAGGIGVTPLLAMAETLHRGGNDFQLHYCARSTSQMAFRDRLANAPYSPSVFLHFDDQPATVLDAGVLLAGPRPIDHLYICGPGGFLEHVRQVAARCGWSTTQVHFEYFAATVEHRQDDAGFDVVLARTARTVHVAPTQTVAAALIEAGVELPMSCEQGVCGTCIVPLLEGDADHRDHYMTNAERESGKLFAPCVSRCRSARLVLDL